MPARMPSKPAQIMESRGLAASIPLAACTARSVGDSVLGLLEDHPYPEPSLPPLDGVDRSVGALLDLVT